MWYGKIILVTYLLVKYFNAINAIHLEMETLSKEIFKLGKEVSIYDTLKLGRKLNVVPKIPSMATGRRFKSPCGTKTNCGIFYRPFVPNMYKLENTIMGVMKKLEQLPPGSPVPQVQTMTDPLGIMQDGMYKEPDCGADTKACIHQYKLSQKINNKLLFKKYNSLRRKLIGYGGRAVWGGEANLFYNE